MLDTDLHAALKTVDEITLTAVKKQLYESGMFEGRTDHNEDSFTQMRLQFIQALVDNFKSEFPEQQGRSWPGGAGSG